jgi:hypothetical protein
MTLIKTAALVLALGASALTAMPTQAGYDFFYEFDEMCMTDYQIRNAIEDEGFEDIYLNVADEDGEIQVKATMDGTVYLIDYDTCDHEIVDIEEL